MIVNAPEIRKPAHSLDFGGGFYTTHNFEQASEFAKKVVLRADKLGLPIGTPIVCEYEFDLKTAEKTLKILKFEKPDAKWLEFVVKNRKSANLQDNYDLIIGPVANDDVYETIRYFERGVYDISATIKKLKVKRLFSQTLFKTDLALALLKFVKSTIV